jgi:CubicO group peptidase (beta-lactamase class C family)
MLLPRLLAIVRFLPLFAFAPLLHAADWPLPAVAPAAAGVSSDRLAIMHQTLDREVSTGRYSGYVTLVARDGKIVESHASGMRDLEAQAPMQADTIFRIASMSKLVTTVGVMRLLEDGRLQLSDPVEKYLPALKNRMVYTGGPVESPTLVPASHAITIRELLNHTAGYYYDAPWSADPIPRALMARAKIWEARDLDEFVQRLAAVPLHQQPGTRFRYGIHVDLLGAIIEKISGQRLDRYLHERIFAPLVMRDSGFLVPNEKRSRLAKLYQIENGKLTPAPDFLPPPTPDHGVLSGGGGLYSTAGDYLRFAQMIANGGELDGVRVLSRKTIELMTANTLTQLADPHPFNQTDLGFGLGVRIVTNLGQSRHLGSPGMFGWDGAATTLYWIDPKERLVSILMTQHLPYNEDDIFASFMNGLYSSLEK